MTRRQASVAASQGIPSVPCAEAALNKDRTCVVIAR